MRTILTTAILLLLAATANAQSVTAVSVFSHRHEKDRKIYTTLDLTCSGAVKYSLFEFIPLDGSGNPVNSATIPIGSGGFMILPDGQSRIPLKTRAFYAFKRFRVRVTAWDGPYGNQTSQLTIEVTNPLAK